MSVSYINLMITADHAVPVEPAGGQSVVTVNSGGPIYYADNPTVSSVINQGSIANGASRTFTSPAWIIGGPTSAVQIAQYSGTAGAPAGATDVVLGSDGLVGGPGGTGLTGSVVTASQPTKGFGPLRLMAVGDSLTAHHQSTSIGSGFWQYSQGWLMWAQALSLGRLRYTGTSGLGGATAAQIRAECLPGIIGASIKPDFCCVLAGVNDFWNVGSPNFPACYAAIKGIATDLIAAGITPILCTIPGYLVGGGGGYTNTTEVLRVNNFIRRLADSLGVPLADFFLVCSDPTANPAGSQTSGTWKANYLAQASSDAVHPGGIAAVAMGQHLVNILNPNSAAEITLPFYSPDGLNLITNALNATNASPGPYPDGWTQNSAGTGATHTLVADASLIGNWWRCVKTVNDLSAYEQDCALPSATPGSLVRLSFLAKINAMSAATSRLRVYMIDNHNNVFLDANVIPQSSQQISAGQQTTLQSAFWLERAADGGSLVAGEGLFVAEGVLASGLGGSPIAKVVVDFNGAGLDVQLAQFSVEQFNAGGTPV